MRTLKVIVVVAMVAASLLGVFSWQQHQKTLVLQKENQELRAKVAEAIASRTVGLEKHLAEVIAAAASGEPINCQMTNDKSIESAYTVLSAFSSKSGLTEEERAAAYDAMWAADLQQQTCYAIRSALDATGRYATD